MPRSTSPRTSRACLALALALAGCGNKGDGPPKAKEDAVAGPPVAPITVPTGGVDQIKRMNFVYGAGSRAYGRALDALRDKPRDWAAVRKHAEAALAEDPLHLDAHHLLARALAHAGEHATAVDHLVTALSHDYLRYGPTLAKDAELADFLATPHGQSVTALADRIREDYQHRIAGGLWLVGRRSTFKWPRELGVQPATTRGEVYAYDRPSKRYLRLTHTDHKVAAFMRSPSGAALAVLGFDKIDRPRIDPKLEPAPDLPPTFASAWIVVLDTTTWEQLGKRIALPAAREIAIGYGAGDQLLVMTARANGRWGTAAPIVSAVDTTSGKVTTIGTPPPEPRVVLTLEEGRLVRGAEGIAGTWSGDPPTTPTLAASGRVIQVPESGAASRSALSLAPGGARLAFATAVDPCAKDVAPSLYVADTRTGELEHLLTSRSRFATRWIDATTLAYEDGEGAIRLWDATTGRQQLELANQAGIALDVLSLAPAPLCKQAPPIVEPVGGEDGEQDDEPPLPPEEGSGPITSPAP